MTIMPITADDFKTEKIKIKLKWLILMGVIAILALAFFAPLLLIGILNGMVIMWFIKPYLTNNVAHVENLQREVAKLTKEVQSLKEGKH